LDECVGFIVHPLDVIGSLAVNVNSKDVTSSPFFAKTLILIALSSYKLFKLEPCYFHRVVAIANSGAP
jgi:hypothetical protein